MKLTSWNVNGLRSASRYGFLDWLALEDADLVCLQEIKVRPEQLEFDLLHPHGYQALWHPAQKAGYSGVAILTKKDPLRVQYGLGDPTIDTEGRVLVAEFEQFVLINSYFPNSQRDHARLGYKLSFCDRMLQFCEEIRKSGKNPILCGDFNIAHQPIDLRNPKANETNAGYLPEERAWMDVFIQTGYVDSFRHFNQDPHHYTWWSYRPGVRQRNIGWRLDYFVVNEEFRDRLSGAAHRPQVSGSDHCPVVLELRK